MLTDFPPRDINEFVDPDVPLLIDLAKLCKFLSTMGQSERKRAAGELLTCRDNNFFKKRQERTPGPVYEEELKVHERFLDSRGRYPGNMGKAGEMTQRGRGSEI